MISDEHYQEVNFFKYCKTCKHQKLLGCEEPCNECLDNPINFESEKPVNWEEKK